MNKLRFKFAVQGKRNLTCVGAMFSTVREALEKVASENEYRAKHKMPLIVAIKSVNLWNARSEFVCWIDGGDE